MFIYQEKQTTYPIFYVILILELPLLLYFVFLGFKQGEYGLTVLVTVMFAFLVFILVNFFHLQIKVYEDKIVFFYGVFDKILYFKDIQSVETKDYDFWKYWGWGIRWSPFDNSRAWVTRSGKGVLIKTTKREYFLSAHEPERLRDLINTRLINKSHD